MRRTSFMKSIVFLSVVTVLFASKSFAQSKDCSQVLEQLKQMKNAQSTIQQSLVANHEMMAQSLDSYSEALEDSAGRAQKAISNNMKKAADSLRERSLKAVSISRKLETGTDELIKTVEKCLK